jgi:hypothetical protein
LHSAVAAQRTILELVVVVAKSRSPTMMIRSSASAVRRHLQRKSRGASTTSSSVRLFHSTGALSDALDPVDTFARRHSTSWTFVVVGLASSFFS